MVVVVSALTLVLPWHQAGSAPACTGLSHYGGGLPILLAIGLAAVIFARTSFGAAPPWSLAPIGVASGVVTALAAGAALTATTTMGHPIPTVALGKAAEMFRAFQWVLVALGMWQVYLHGAVLLRRR